MTEPPIHHDPERQRFVASVDGDTAFLRYQRAGADTLDFRSTFVPRARRRQGMGHRLVRHALDYAREAGYRVIPTCWFVREIMEETPEYGQLRQVTGHGGSVTGDREGPRGSV